MNENSFDNQSCIGIHLDKEDYDITPAGNTTIPVLIRNQGIEEDRFILTIEELPEDGFRPHLRLSIWVQGSRKRSSLASRHQFYQSTIQVRNFSGSEPPARDTPTNLLNQKLPSPSLLSMV